MVIFTTKERLYSAFSSIEPTELYKKKLLKRRASEKMRIS